MDRWLKSYDPPPTTTTTTTTTTTAIATTTTIATMLHFVSCIYLNLISYPNRLSMGVTSLSSMKD
jgi:hypothetical protein